MKLSKRGKEIRKTTSHLVFLLFFFFGFCVYECVVVRGVATQCRDRCIGCTCASMAVDKKKKEKEKGDGAKRMSIIC